MRVEIRIGESAGEGEDLLDIGLVVQLQGTLLEDGEVHMELVLPISEHAELRSQSMDGFVYIHVEVLKSTRVTHE